MLAPCNDEGKENALYYISQTMVGVEINNSSMEKICLALVFVAPLKHILSKAKLAILLAPFDNFVPQKAVNPSSTPMSRY